MLYPSAMTRIVDD
jgi:hypothetical protein